MGAALGYPGIVLGPHLGQVTGALFPSDALAEHWERLDEFEGRGYDRVLTSVLLADGRVEDAYVYVLREAPDG